jgi:hypothetical protein
LDFGYSPVINRFSLVRSIKRMRSSNIAATCLSKNARHWKEIVSNGNKCEKDASGIDMEAAF